MASLVRSFVLAFCVAPLQWDERLFQPIDYTSRSGAYVLHVDPADKRGKGPMHAHLVHDKAELWSAEIPWTFEEAAVAADGTVVAYGDVKLGESSALRLAVIDAHGKVLKQHDLKHEAWVMHGPALPSAIGPVLVHDAAGVAFVRVLRVDQGSPSPWKQLVLATGEFADDVLPRCPLTLADGQHVFERETRVIGDTGLTLCHWLTLDFRRIDMPWSKSGGVFALVDLKGEAVWSLPLLDDYADKTSEEANEKVSNEFSWAELILGAGPGDTFALRHVRENARVEYVVEKDTAAAKGWRVRETSRSPFTKAPPPAHAPVAFERIELAQSGSIALAAAPSQDASAIRNVFELGVTDDGNAEFVRSDGERAFTYVRLRADGAVDFEKDLSPLVPPGCDRLQAFDLTGDRWLIALATKPPAWFVFDVRTGKSTPIPFACGGYGASVAPFADGSFVAISSDHAHSNVSTEIHYVRADGTLAWSEEVGGWGEDDTPFQKSVYLADAVAATSDKTFAILGSRSVATIDLEKNVLRSVELADVLGRAAGYVSDLVADGRGGVLFQESDTFWRVDAAGKPAGSFVPKRADGTRDALFDVYLRAGKDGRWWTSDRSRIYRLDANGVVDLVFGPALDDAALSEPDDTLVDALGRVLVRDRFSEALHVFDSNGAKVCVCKVPKDERTGSYHYKSIRGDADGSLWMTVNDGVARFDAKGERAATVKRGGDSVREYAALEGTDPVFVATSKLERRPDGRWLANVQDRAVLADGRRVLLESPQEDGAPPELHFYSPTSEPIDSLVLPAGTGARRLSASARWLVVGGFDPGWTLVRIADRKVFRFEPPAAEGGVSDVGQTPDGKTLLVLRGMELVRYALP